MNKLFLMLFFCLCSFVGIAQEFKLEIERTVYYKMDNKQDLVYVNTENYVKQLTMFQYNKEFVSINFYIGEFRYTYMFDYEYTDTINNEVPTEYWRCEVQDAIMMLTDNTITIYSFRDKWAIVYHLWE